MLTMIKKIKTGETQRERNSEQKRKNYYILYF